MRTGTRLGWLGVQVAELDQLDGRTGWGRGADVLDGPVWTQRDRPLGRGRGQRAPLGPAG